MPWKPREIGGSLECEAGGFRLAVTNQSGAVTEEMVKRAAVALCRSWPKDPNGCAALCLDRLGSIPKDGCRHAISVHGARARAALEAARGAEAGE